MLWNADETAGNFGIFIRWAPDFDRRIYLRDPLDKNGFSTDKDTEVTSNFTGFSENKVELDGPEHKRSCLSAFQDN